MARPSKKPSPAVGETAVLHKAKRSRPHLAQELMENGHVETAKSVADNLLPHVKPLAYGQGRTLAYDEEGVVK